jgi:hypothetical protein
MPTMPATAPTAHTSRGRARPWWAGPATAALASLALVATACAGGTPRPGPADATASNSGQNSIVNGGSVPADGQRESMGGFSVDFARCMRSHGVPNFPDPTGRAGQLGPDSGIDLASPQFQAAVNGPCKSLAPLAWVDSGPGTAPRG